MSLSTKPGLQTAAIFCGLILLSSSAIWSVEFYVNQDGSPHLYNAFLIRELIEGNQEISNFVALNPVLIPNLTGHWLLALLVFVFSPAIASKIFVTLLFAGLVASVCWLRRQVAGDEDFLTAMLFGTALAFNWMWFLGFYNFILGAIGIALTLGFWWRWREDFNFWRGLVVFLLILFVFFSHLISYGVLVGILFLLSLANRRAKTTFWTLAATLPTLPFLFNFLRLSNSSDKIAPVWNYLQNPLSPQDWFLHLRSADPFQLISRKSIPFIEISSTFFGFFSPSLWLLIASACLTAATILIWKKQKAENVNSLIWLAMTVLLCLLWAFAPDNFGKSHGGFLRERIMLLGLICFAPVFRLTGYPILRRAAQFCLIFIILFQTAVVWDYALHANRLAKEVLAAKNQIGENQSFGSIVINRDGCQFKPIPRSNLTAFMAVGKTGRFWDNYELGYYLFPVVARNPEDRRLIYEFRESNTFDFCDPNEKADEKFAKLNEQLQNHHRQIEVLLVWGKDERIEAMIAEWYEKEPFFAEGDIRLFRLRQNFRDSVQK